jgi:SAM-dependent methyltransferase
MTPLSEKTLAEVIAERRAERPSLRRQPYGWLRWRVRTSRAKARRKWFQHVVKGRLGVNHVRNWVTDWRYGGFAGGGSGSSHEDEGMLGFTAVDYQQLDKVFNARNGLELRHDDILVDIGCGKGRVINWWLGHGPGNRIYGIELEDGLAAQARRRLARWPNVTIITGDALRELPPDATLIWMFNPFWADVVERFKERLVDVYGLDSPVRVVYFMPLFEQTFAGDPRFVVREVKTKPIYRCVIITFAGAPAPASTRTRPASASSGT